MNRGRRILLAGMAVAALAGGVLVFWRRPRPLSAQAFAALYATPVIPPSGPLTTFHLGHSLVGREMPAQLASMAGHDHASQLGWGTSLKDHWTDSIAGFDTENAHPHYRDAREALGSGDYDAVILTEMVEIRQAIRYHDSARHLAEWARLARAGNPGVRLYLYETWHPLDDPEGWLARLDADLARHWEAEILRPALAEPGVGPIHVIPAGQVMAAATRAMEAGQVPGLTDRRQLFATNPDGTPDNIHLSEIGAWLVALTHHATLYHRLPSPGSALDPQAESVLRQVVWSTVTGYPPSGVPAETLGEHG